MSFHNTFTDGTPSADGTPPADTKASTGAMKCGFVAVVGRPNVGKSSLVNRLVGQKVAITSPKPQTTRDNILGIGNYGDAQIVFVDTPGVHEPRTKLGERMMSYAGAAAKGVDLVLVVMNAEYGVLRQDRELLERHLKSAPVFAVLNKADLKKDKREMLPEIAKLKDVPGLEIFPTSCKTGHNLDVLLERIKAVMPEGEPFYPEDEYTDRSERFLAAESVREKILLYLQEEIPHGVMTTVESMRETETTQDISVLIVVEKAGHKPIILGKGGAMIKKIGAAARKDIEARSGKKVNLKTFVKVVENWRDKPAVFTSD